MVVRRLGIHMGITVVIKICFMKISLIIRLKMIIRHVIRQVLLGLSPGCLH